MTIVIITGGPHRDPGRKLDAQRAFSNADGGAGRGLIGYTDLREARDGVWQFTHEGTLYELHDVVEVRRTGDVEDAKPARKGRA